jgi:hypothetical protein
MAAHRYGQAHALNCKATEHKRHSTPWIGKQRQRGKRKKEPGGHHQ